MSYDSQLTQYERNTPYYGFRKDLPLTSEEYRKYGCKYGSYDEDNSTPINRSNSKHKSICLLVDTDSSTGTGKVRRIMFQFPSISLTVFNHSLNNEDL